MESWLVKTPGFTQEVVLELKYSYTSKKLSSKILPLNNRIKTCNGWGSFLAHPEAKGILSEKGLT